MTSSHIVYQGEQKIHLKKQLYQTVHTLFVLGTSKHVLVF